MIINRLPKILEEKDINLSELTRKSGLAYRTVIKIVYGDITSIHIRALDKLCNALNVQPGDLFVYKDGEIVDRPVLEQLPSYVSEFNKRVEKVTVLSEVD